MTEPRHDDTARQPLWGLLSGLSLEQLWQDVRFGMRVLRKAPGVALTAVVTLAIGIAVVTAMFSVW